MTSDANVSADLITIDGESYSQSDLSDEQLYFIRQIQSCNLKVNSLKFDLDQVQASAMVFNQRLSKSVEKIKISSPQYENHEWEIFSFLFETKETKIKLNWENSEFKWINKNELKNYQTVPSLDKILFNLL